MLLVFVVVRRVYISLSVRGNVAVAHEYSGKGEDWTGICLGFLVFPCNIVFFFFAVLGLIIHWQHLTLLVCNWFEDNFSDSCRFDFHSFF